MEIIESIRQSLAQAPRIVEGLVAAAPKEALTWREANGSWNIERWSYAPVQPPGLVASAPRT